MLAAKDVILCHGQAQTVLLQKISYCLEFSAVTVDDITTILVFLEGSFTKIPAISVVMSFQPSLFLESTGAAICSPCRSRQALKQELSENSSQTCIVTITRKPQHRCSCPLTRIWRFLQIQWPKVFSICLHVPEKWSHQY